VVKPKKEKKTGKRKARTTQTEGGTWGKKKKMGGGSKNKKGDQKYQRTELRGKGGDISETIGGKEGRTARRKNCP